MNTTISYGASGVFGHPGPWLALESNPEVFTEFGQKKLDESERLAESGWIFNPRGSMYGIFTYIGIISNYFRGQCR